MELMTRWPHCLLHQGHCYIENGGSHGGNHFNFEPREWGMWATAIVNKKAIADYPPRNIEFDAILENYRLKGKGKKKGKKSHHRRGYSESSDSDIPNNKYRPVIVKVAHPTFSPPVRRYSNPTSPSKPRIAKEKSIIELLRHVGYNPAQFNEKALTDYLAWCKENLPGDYGDAYDLLSVHEIGVDMLDLIPDAGTLSSLTKIPFGTATRILKNCREWLKSVETNVA